MILREESNSQKAKTVYIKSLICFQEVFSFFPLECYPLGQGTWEMGENFPQLLRNLGYSTKRIMLVAQFPIFFLSHCGGGTEY